MPAMPTLFAALTLTCSLGLLSLPALAGPRYSVTALPSNTSVSSLNEQGQVVGHLGSPDGQRAYVWSKNGFQLIPAPTPSVDNVATAINNLGASVGYAGLPGAGQRAFRYAEGKLTELDILGASNSYATAINDSGQVAGGYMTGKDVRAYLYGNGAATDLGTLGGSFATANGINGAGHVVGFSNLDDSATFLAHAFLYADGVMTDLGTMAGASLSEATAINDRGQITGHGWVQGSQHAFLYEAGVMRDLGTLGGRYSFAYDINNAGQIVGWSNDPDNLGSLAFLYDGISMLNLNSLIDPNAGWTLLEARAINDRGQIAAYGCRAELCGGVLLELAATPISEPPTGMLMLAALISMGWRRISAACRCAGCHLHRMARNR